MKYLKKFNESLDNIADICKAYGIINYTISDSLVDVDGDVYISSKSLTKLPLKFGKVTGYFNCSNNQLISLEGAPNSVGGNFHCSDNKLDSLEGAPKSVGGNFDCRSNKLVSLENFPPNIKGLRCVDNPIYKYWKGLNIDDLELFLYMDINTTDPDEISEEKINYIKNR
jgi:hypothetical protein